MNGRTDEQKSPCSTGLHPLRTAAQKELVVHNKDWGSRPMRADLRPVGADFNQVRVDFWPDRADFRSEGADFRPGRGEDLQHKIQPRGPILASRPKSQPQGLNPSLKADIPAPIMKSGSKAQIPIPRPKSQLWGPNLNCYKYKEKEKFPQVLKHRSSVPLGSLPCSLAHLQLQPT